MFESKYVVEEGIVSRTNQDGTVIIMKMDEGNTFFKINGVAAVVWKELALKKDINDIYHSALAEYNVTENQLKSDIQNLLDSLLAKSLIKKN